MWTCPKCNAQFYHKNQAHSCGNFSLSKFLEGRSALAINLFDYFLTQYRTMGPFELHTVKTRVALLGQMRFCAVNRLGANFIDVHLVLTEPYPKHSCFRRIENIDDRFFVHHMRIQRESDITMEVKAFMKMAYDVGQRMHIKKSTVIT
jgi:hypothetical protein